MCTRTSGNVQTLSRLVATTAVLHSHAVLQMVVVMVAAMVALAV